LDLLLSNRSLKGSVRLPDAIGLSSDDAFEIVPALPTELEVKDRIVVDLEFLDVPRELIQDGGDVDEQQAALLPSELLPLDVTIDRLTYSNQELGSWSFLLTASNTAALVHGIDASVDAVKILSDEDDGLLWAVDANGTANTGVNLEVASDEFTPFLKRLAGDEQQMPMTSKTIAANVSLDWPGYPQEVSMDELSGSVNFNLSEGRFYQASEGATGLMKLMGLINFDTIVRRVQLDFADVYKEGLSFDEIDGRVAIDRNVLSFYDEPIVFEGPSSEFKLAGEIDLNSNTIDADLVATLPVADNLPWIGVIAGGLPGVAGTYVLSKVFDSQLKKLSSALYSINGSLDDPEVKFEQLFQDKNRAESKDDEFKVD
jgi:uncharacterized protein YhdP